MLAVPELGDPEALDDLVKRLDGTLHTSLADPDGRGTRAGIISKPALSKIEQISAFPEHLAPVQVEDDGTTIDSMGRPALPTRIRTRRSPRRLLCAQQLRAAHKASSPVQGRRIAEKVLASFPTCPIPKIKRLGKTLKLWREAFLAYFDTGRASNGGTEAINGLIELHCRVARGFRNRGHYRLRMLLIGGGLTHPHRR